LRESLDRMNSAVFHADSKMIVDLPNPMMGGVN
jgi:hypothetical protein